MPIGADGEYAQAYEQVGTVRDQERDLVRSSLGIGKTVKGEELFNVYMINIMAPRGTSMF